MYLTSFALTYPGQDKQVPPCAEDPFGQGWRRETQSVADMFILTAEQDVKSPEK